MLSSLLGRRPALVTAATAMALAVGTLVVPISYEHTTGYELTLTIDGAGVEQSQVMDIAETFQDAVGADGVSIDALMDDGALSYVVGASTAGDARAAADAFAAELGNLGYPAAVRAVPIKETISTNVYAYAYDRVIRISIDGKSAAELESEIRRQLAAAGVTAQVSVTRRDANHQEVRIDAEHLHDGDRAHRGAPEIVLTEGGQPIVDGTGLNVMKEKDESGAETLILKVTYGGRRVQAKIPNTQDMSDAAIAAAIESQLEAAGIRARVTVNGDDVRVEKL